MRHPHAPHPHLNYSIAIVLALIAVTYASFVYIPDKENMFVIEKETKPDSIIDNLYHEGYIPNKLAYVILKFGSNSWREIKEGVYVLPGKLNALALYSFLSNPEYQYVALNPGMRKEQVGDLLAKKLSWNDNRTEIFSNKKPLCEYKPTEGYLFPDKYLISAQLPALIVQDKMQERFDEIYNEISSRAKKKDVPMHEIVTIASLIQREAAGKQDMRLISGIIWNRIKKEMPLQIDATLQYVKGGEENWWPQVESKDKYLESPYNTYENKDLPPGPIANPGKDALIAALNPVDTACLFYLHDNNHQIHCSSNYKSHLNNIKWYLR
jgi:UPF0755 protein